MGYMLDEDVWKDFKNSNLAEFAVGGPSFEILEKSYREVTENLYPLSFEVNEFGYPTSDYFYRLPSEDSRVEFLFSKLKRTSYILSTSANSKNSGSGNLDYALLSFICDEGVSDYYEILSTNHESSSRYDYGFRPMVCLRSDIKLIEETNGTLSISK